MKELKFLNRLEKEGKLKLVEPSREIKISYLEKAKNSLKSAKVLLQNNLYENSVAMSYYVLYNSLISFLYKIGIKCENHTGSILLLKLLFNQEDLSKIILFAKEERIDKQYYVSSSDKFQLNKESTEEMIKVAEDFLVEITLLIEKTGSEDVRNYRIKFLKFIKTGQKRLKY